MTWHCAACGTTWALPINSNPGMQACPRCSRWMELAADDSGGPDHA